MVIFLYLSGSRVRRSICIGLPKGGRRTVVPVPEPARSRGQYK